MASDEGPQKLTILQESAPWDAEAGCFGHCDPEGWHRPCRDHTDGDRDA